MKLLGALLRKSIGPGEWPDLLPGDVDSESETGIEGQLTAGELKGARPSLEVP